MILFLTAFLGFLVYKIMSPFLTAIAWAMVFSLIFYPVFLFILRYVRFRSLASVISLMIMLIVLIGPIAFLSQLLIIEMRASLDRWTPERIEQIKAYIDHMRMLTPFEQITPYIGEVNMPSQDVIMEGIKKAGNWLIEHLTITNVVSLVADFLFTIFTVFFLLRDGPGFLSKARDFMPFTEREKDRLVSQVKDMIVSTVYGGAIVAIIQGILGGLAYYLLGINSPVMWGVAMCIMSFVPMVGTFAIWGTASAYFFLTGSMLKGAGLFIYGVLVISMVDNILRPLIIGSRTKMPTILILFSVLGGIKLFGMIGFVAGPLIMAVFLSVLHIFRHIEDDLDDAVDTGERR
jgi:predicted PurR-regulated permease PerM